MAVDVVAFGAGEDGDVDEAGEVVRAGPEVVNHLAFVREGRVGDAAHEEEIGGEERAGGGDKASPSEQEEESGGGDVDGADALEDAGDAEAAGVEEVAAENRGV